MRHSLSVLSAALCAVGLSAVAHADTTFNLTNATFASGGTATGTIQIDTTAGTFDTLDLRVTADGITDAFSGVPSHQSVFQGNQYFEYSYADGDLLLIELPVASLVGYAGGPICPTSSCSGYTGYFSSEGGKNLDRFTTGSLVAATPEPSSILLLSTGLLSIAGATRRRLFHA